jgi:LuxR family maltose regulon positive regulatory protein
LREAVELAQSLGLRNVFADAHPALADLILRSGAVPAVPRAEPPSLAARRLAAEGLAGRFIAAALTPKEREVLQLVARSLSNKEIGRAMAVGEETVKWHMKNVFLTRDAVSRKQAVAKARMFGLIAEIA